MGLQQPLRGDAGIAGAIRPSRVGGHPDSRVSGNSREGPPWPRRILHMPKLSVRDIDVSNRTVLVRVDFNVPTEEKDGRISITDDTRIRETLPDDQVPARPGRQSGLDGALRPSQREAGAEIFARPRRGAVGGIAGGAGAVQPGDASATAWKSGWTRSRRARCSCSKTCASTRRRKRTTPSFRKRWRDWASLRQRRFRRGAPRACVDRRRGRLRDRGRHGAADGEGTQVSPGRTRRTRPGRSSSFSAARRFRTRSASSRR